MTDNTITEALLARIEALEARIAALEPKPAEPPPTTYRDPSGIERDMNGQVIVEDSEEAHQDRMQSVRQANGQAIEASERGLPRGWHRDPFGLVRDKEGNRRDPNDPEIQSGSQPTPAVETVKNFRYED